MLERYAGGRIGLPSNLHRPLSRRSMLRGGGMALTAAGAALLFGCGGDGPEAALGEGELETTTLRFHKHYTMCHAPQYVARDYLLEEGFTDIQYVATPGYAEIQDKIAAGEIDMGVNFAASMTERIDQKEPLVALAGIHIGCAELFAREGVTNLGDLRGKTVGVHQIRATGADVAYFSALLDFVGIDPVKDVKVVAVSSPEQAIQLLAAGTIDAMWGSPPVSSQLHSFGVGHVLLNTHLDAPWSQYYCCMLIANRTFIEKNPVATKRALRAILRGTDLCAQDPVRAARILVDEKFTANYAYALEAMSTIPYGVWRTHDPEISLLFYANRFNQSGRITSTPNEIVARGSDWRFLNQLKREMAYLPGPNATGFALNCEIPGFNGG